MGSGIVYRTHAAMNVPSKENPIVTNSEGGLSTGVFTLFLLGVDIAATRGVGVGDGDLSEVVV